MLTKTPRRFRAHFFTVFAFAALSMLMIGCASAPNTPPNYNVTCRKNAAFEVDKPTAFDPELGGYWLVGNGVTVSISPIPGRTSPGSDLVLSLRTTPTSSGKTNLSLLRIVTPQHRITTRLQEKNVLRVELAEDASHVDLLRDTGYVRISENGNRMKVVLSGEFLQRYAPNGAALTWFDTSPGAIVIR